MKRLELLALEGLPEIVPGDDLAGLLLEALEAARIDLRHGDVLVVAHKVVSKAEGRLRELAEVRPSPLAVRWAAAHQLDARQVQVVLDESARVVRMERGVLITETRHGFVCANAGVDASNAPIGHVVLLPEDPDASAERLRRTLAEETGARLAVLITDTWGRPWRTGIVNFAIGASGLEVFVDHRGSHDSAGRELRVTVVAAADELAGAAELLMGKTSGTPAVLVRGFESPGGGSGSAAELLREQRDDLFR